MPASAGMTAWVCFAGATFLGCVALIPSHTGGSRYPGVYSCHTGESRYPGHFSFAFCLCWMLLLCLPISTMERVPQKDASPGCMGLDTGFRRHDGSPA